MTTIRRALGHALKPTYDGRAIKAQAPGSLGFRGKGGSAVVTLFRDQRWSRGQALNLESERRWGTSSRLAKILSLYRIDNKRLELYKSWLSMKILLSYWSILHSSRSVRVIGFGKTLVPVCQVPKLLVQPLGAPVSPK